jgi:hypothetical protein
VKIISLFVLIGCGSAIYPQLIFGRDHRSIIDKRQAVWPVFATDFTSKAIEHSREITPQLYLVIEQIDAPAMNCSTNDAEFHTAKNPEYSISARAVHAQ